MAKNSTRMGQTVGLDVSDRSSTYVMLDRRGEVVAEGKVPSTCAGIRRQFGDGRRYRIALEVGGHSPWMSRLLQELGHEVIVANPRQVALIGHNLRKTDRLDALRLARLARSDPRLLSPITHRSQEAQQDLELLRAREQLVRARTSLINHVRGAVKAVGERLPACSSPSFAHKVADLLPEGLKPALTPLLAMVQELTNQIKAMDRQVLQLIEGRYPAARTLMDQIHGVGPLTALAYVLTIERPEQFSSSRRVGAYLGLTRRQRDSGDSQPQLHITKAGDAFLRRLLVQCAHYTLGPFGMDSDLRRWGLALAARIGRKRAIIAVARKLAVLMHRLWVTGEVYEPLRRSEPVAA